MNRLSPSSTEHSRRFNGRRGAVPFVVLTGLATLLNGCGLVTVKKTEAPAPATAPAPAGAPEVATTVLAPAASLPPTAQLPPAIAPETPTSLTPSESTAAPQKAGTLVTMDGEMACVPHKPTAQPVIALCMGGFFDEGTRLYYDIDFPAVNDPAAAPTPRLNMGDELHIIGQIIPPTDKSEDYEYAATIQVTEFSVTGHSSPAELLPPSDGSEPKVEPL